MAYFDDSYVDRTNRPKVSVLQNNAYQLRLQRYEIFKEQNPETGNFDLTLEFSDGKKLYVHKFHIISVSETLNAMLSDRWLNNGDETVKIESYSSENFFQFLSFLYSGGCDLTNENVFQLTDMAEFYGIQTLRDFCDSFLSKMECTMENFFDMIELQERYSLKDFNVSLQYFFGRNFKALIGAQKFLTLKKSVIKLLLSFKRSSDSEEDFFKAVYKWAEGQALIKHAASVEQDFNMDGAIKNELSEILPLLKFGRMKYEFVKSLIDEKKFLFSLSESIQVLSVSKRLWDTWARNNDEEDMIKLVYELAEKQALETQKIDPETDLKDAIKKELDEIIPVIDFSKIRFRFLKVFLADKEYLFSPKQLCKALSMSLKQNKDEEQNAFQKVYELAEKEAIKKQQLSLGDNCELNKTIKEELSEVLEIFHYDNMLFGFLIEFIVPKSFLFPVRKLYGMLWRTAGVNDHETLFSTAYKLAETEVSKMQSLSAHPDFNFNGLLKKQLYDLLLYQIKFPRMKLEFIIQNIVEKRFLFSSSEMYNHLVKCQRNPEQEEIFFKALYSVAEKYVLEKQEANPAEMFNLKVAVFKELSEYIPHVKFDQMSLEYLSDFVVEKGFIFKAENLKKLIVNARKRYNNEEQLFEIIYGLIEKQTHAKKLFWFNNNANFNFAKTMKTDLSEINPYIEFYQMSKTFLTDFVVKNGVLSVDESERLFSYRIVVENDGKTLTGAFVDVFGIQKAIEPDGYGFSVLSSSNKQRFFRLKFEIPKTPSAVKKMKGVEWYLALEKCGTLVLQSYGHVKATDYLIAEMQTRDDFTLSKGSWTTLKSFVKTDD